MRLIYDPDEKRIKLGETVTLLNWLKAVPEEVYAPTINYTSSC